MTEFVAAIVAFPTVVFSVLLGVVFLYWLFVLMGLLDIEWLDSLTGLDSAEGAMEGAVEGAVDGAVEAAVDGALDGAVEGAVDGAMEGAADAALDGAADAALDGAADAALDGAAEGATDAAADTLDGSEADTVGGLRGMLNALGIRGVPCTVVGSFVILWAWTLSYVGNQFVALLGWSGAAAVIAGCVLALVALVLGTLGGALTTRPLRRVFVTPGAASRAEFVGKTCTVTTGRVNAEFGQAEIQDGGAGLLVQVRCDRPNELKRGSKALVYDYSKKRGIYQVAPLDKGLDEVRRFLEDVEGE